MKKHLLPTVHDHMMEAHDHLHELCGLGAKEAGREISQANLDKLGLAHNHMAQACGLSCRYLSGSDFRNAPATQNAPKRTTAKPGADYRARESITEEYKASGPAQVSMREYTEEEDSAVKWLEGIGWDLRW